MSLAELPERLRSLSPVGEVTADQSVPSQYRMVPFCPTAQMSFGPLPQMAFTGSNLPEVSEMEDLLVEYAGCMRDNGVDMPDPDFSGGSVMIDLGIADPNDPTFQAADEACRSILAGFGPMGG